MSATQLQPCKTARDLEGRRHSRRQARHRGRLRQGRRRQVHHLLQSRARLRRDRAEGRHPRRRHLRSVATKTVRPARQAAADRPAHAGADGAVRRQGDVDRLSGRGRPRHDLARADGDLGDHADAARGGVGRSRRSGRRPAARHRRCAAHHGAAGAAVRRGDRLDAAGHRADRRAARHRDVPEGQRPDAGRDREHVELLLPDLQPCDADLRPWRRAARGRDAAAFPFSARSRSTSRSARPPTTAARSSRPSPTAFMPGTTSSIARDDLVGDRHRRGEAGRAPRIVIE